MNTKKIYSSDKMGKHVVKKSRKPSRKSKKVSKQKNQFNYQRWNKQNKQKKQKKQYNQYNQNNQNKSNQTWKNLQIINRLEKGVILDGYYSSDGFNVIIYNVKSRELVKWIDQSVESMMEFEDDIIPIINEQKGKLSKYKILRKKNLLLEEIETTVKLDIKSSFNQINKLERRKYRRNLPIPDQLSYFHEQQIIPGTWIKITNNKIITIIEGDQQNIEEKQDRIKQLLIGDFPEIIDLCITNMPVFEDTIPSIRRIAFDIEVSSPRGTFPIPELAKFPIHSIATKDSNGKVIIFLLSFVPTKTEIQNVESELGYLPKIRTFNIEKQLIQSFFDEIIQYPIILSYNGDGFDLPYLYHRSLKLGLDPPISRGHYYFSRWEYQFRKNIHFDLFSFLNNNAVRLYAFGGKYSRTRLQDVGEALLGKKKIEHDLWFDEMSRDEIIVYNVRDAELTLELTTFDNELMMALILILMRVGRFTLSFVNRAPISKWIMNWIVAEHEKRGLAIPRQEDLKRLKGSFESKAMIDGKQYQGAIVLDSKAGIFWNVAVVDFNSLYPSTIKNYNLSYETIRCNHKTCQYNKVAELDHWICTKRLGIMAALVGYVREIRVRYYKAEAKSDDKITAALANTIQAALKVFINAAYGVFGSSSFYLYCPPIAESTTAIARQCLLQAKNLAESMDLVVLAGDTDSIFVHNINKEQLARLTQWSIIDLGIELGIDYMFRFLVLSGRKKNYFGVTTDSKLIVKGLVLKKSNTAIFIKETFNRITDEMVKVESNKELEKAKLFMIKQIQLILSKLHNTEIPLEQLANMVTLNKSFDEYKSKTPAVQLAIQRMTPENHRSITQKEQFLSVRVKPFDARVLTNKFPNFPMGTILSCNYKELSKITGYWEVDLKSYELAIIKAFEPLFDAFNLDWQTTVEGYQDISDFFDPNIADYPADIRYRVIPLTEFE